MTNNHDKTSNIPTKNKFDNEPKNFGQIDYKITSKVNEEEQSKKNNTFTIAEPKIDTATNLDILKKYIKSNQNSKTITTFDNKDFKSKIETITNANTSQDNKKIEPKIENIQKSDKKDLISTSPMYDNKYKETTIIQKKEDIVDNTKKVDNTQKVNPITEATTTLQKKQNINTKEYKTINYVDKASASKAVDTGLYQNFISKETTSNISSPKYVINTASSEKVPKIDTSTLLTNKTKSIPANNITQTLDLTSYLINEPVVDTIITTTTNSDKAPLKTTPKLETTQLPTTSPILDFIPTIDTTQFFSTERKPDKENQIDNSETIVIDPLPHIKNNTIIYKTTSPNINDMINSTSPSSANNGITFIENKTTSIINPINTDLSSGITNAYNTNVILEENKKKIDIRPDVRIEEYKTITSPVELNIRPDVRIEEYKTITSPVELNPPKTTIITLPPPQPIYIQKSEPITIKVPKVHKVFIPKIKKVYVPNKTKIYIQNPNSSTNIYEMPKHSEHSHHYHHQVSHQSNIYSDKKYNYSQPNKNIPIVANQISNQKISLVPIPKFKNVKSLVPIPKFKNVKSLVPVPKFKNVKSVVPIPKLPSSKITTILPQPTIEKSSNSNPMIPYLYNRTTYHTPNKHARNFKLEQSNINKNFALYHTSTGNRNKKMKNGIYMNKLYNAIV